MTSTLIPRKQNRSLAFISLIVIPLVVSWFPALLAFAEVALLPMLVIALLFPAICITLSSLIALGRLTISQLSIVFLGTTLAPVFTMLLAAIIPSSLYRLIPIPNGRFSVIFDFACASITMWLFISCLFILAFRRRLPVIFVPAIAISAVIAPILMGLVVLTPDGFAGPQDPTFARVTIFYSFLAFPTIVLGILLYLHADVIRNNQFPELMYLPDEGASPTP